MIGNDVWIGANVTILDGIRIGDGAIVATNALVTKNVPPYAILGGVPAKQLKKRFTDEQIGFLLKLKWWDKREEWISEHAKYFNSIDELKHIVENE
jgi:serine acetyltransferase